MSARVRDLRALLVAGVMLVVAMLAASAVVWPLVPADVAVPIHASGGEVDRWAGKSEALLVAPALAVGLVVLAMVAGLALGGRSERPHRTTKAFGGWVIVGVVVVAGMHAVMLANALGADLPVFDILMVATAVCVAAFGVWLVVARIERNHLVGVRLPWTMRSDTTWHKTNWLSGALLTLLGAVLVAVAATAPDLFAAVLLGGLAIVVVVSGAYSYTLERSNETDTQLN